MTIKQALAQANKKLLPKINKALEKEVYEVVKAEEIPTILSVVYDAYTDEKHPKVYLRRLSDGGLLDDSNIVIRGGKAANGSIAIENVTPANHEGVNEHSYDKVTVNKNLSELIEYGYGYKGYKYDFPYGDEAWRFLQPRPFTQKTAENLKSSGAHIAALKNGLQRQGVKVT